MRLHPITVKDKTMLPDVKILRGAVEDSTAQKIKINPKNSLWASRLDHPCLRYNELGLLRWQDELAVPRSLQEVFEEGHSQEETTLKILGESGFKIRQTQRPLFEYVSKNGKILRYGISGRMDLEISHDGLLASEWYPAEIKSCDPYTFESIDEDRDAWQFAESKRHYLRNYPSQMCTYLLMSGKELGLMIFKSKMARRLKFVWCPISYEVGERLYRNAEEINRVVAEIQGGAESETTLSPRIEYDDKICGNCSFRHICLPDIQYGGQTIELSPEVEADLERRDILKSYVEEYDDLDEKVKKQFKARGDGKYLVGSRFNVTVKTTETTRYKVPDEIKAPYAEPGTMTRVDIKKVKS